ncbi:MAG: hypothetical protein K2P78_08660, partial [Gemmataceae bacterium]|nr:hypothetical protein [Gemmataceae bacterium]
MKEANEDPVWGGTKYWKDFLWLSADPTFLRERATYLGEVVHPNAVPLAPGASYEVVFRTTLPKGAAGEYYLHVQLDAHNDIDPRQDPSGSRRLLTGWWPADRGRNDDWLGNFDHWAYEDPANNLFSAKVVVQYREPDLRAEGVTVGTGATSGRQLDVTYTVANRGSRDTREDGWADRAFLSRDPSLDDKDLFLGEFSHTGVLRAGAAYTNALTVTLPEGVGGSFHLLVYTDAAAGMDLAGNTLSDIGFNLLGVGFEKPSPLAPWDLASESSRGLGRGRVPEYQDEGNNVAAVALPITPTPAPDLRVAAVAAPERVARGQTIDVTYTVANVGPAGTPASQPEWVDYVYLSRDPVLDLRADRYLTSVEHTGGLAAGAAYAVARTLQLPTDLLGPWYVLVVTDPVRSGVIGQVFESGKERNNDRASPVPVVVELPPPADLEVQDVRGPAAAKPGETAEIVWTVKNTSREPANGTWTDGAFASADGAWDVGDRYVGRLAFAGTLLPGQEYTATLRAALPALTPGAYRLVVRTDV